MGLINQINAAFQKSQQALKKAESAVEGNTQMQTQLQSIEKEMEGLNGNKDFDYQQYATKTLYGSHVGLPVLSLTGDMTGISKQNKVALAWKFGNLSGTCTLKWQGASSIAYDKKNFTITFDEKQTIIEKWGAQKKYCLKANYVDFSHCRNIVAAKLWGQTVKARSTRNDKLYPLPNGGAIDGFPIMVVINENYQGLYTFNIPKDKWMFGMGSGEKECILTAETHSKPTQFAALAKVDATDFEVEYAPDEADTQWAKDSVNALIQAVLDFKGTSAADVESALGSYVDLDSAVDYFIFTCMLVLTDNLDKNYILMTFDGTKWMFSQYDLDTAFGNHWDGKGYSNASTVVPLSTFASTHKLMGILYKCYREKIKSRYATLRKNILSEGNVQITLENFLVDVPKAVLNQEVQRWPKIPGTMTNALSQILSWYHLRCIAMDAEVNAL